MSKYTKKFLIFTLVFTVAIFLSACQKSNQPQNVQNQQEQGVTGQNQSAVEGATITINAGGVNPASLGVKSGDKVTFTNNTDKAIQIASDPHPTHLDNKEISAGNFVLELEAGQNIVVDLIKKGSWGWHDHLNPNTKGTITVQ